MPNSVRFDHYEVLTRDDGSMFELGRGAMGITYKASDTNLRVPVALKVINAAYLDSQLARDSFVREARSAAQLRHANVASVFHLGVDGDSYFYAMEFIDGETVDALIRKQGPLKPVLALNVADQVARALNAAAARGLVHRDIKPSNLMLVRDGDEVTVKVIDFGLARGSSAEEHAAEAGAGFVGTPHFASPEQLAEREIDVRSDIYSLGATLWFMLTGTTVFSGPVVQVMQLHQTTEPAWEKLAALSPTIVALLRRLLAKAPAARPQTPSVLRSEIAACLTQVSADAPAAAAPAAVNEDFVTLLGSASATTVEGIFDLGTTIADRYRLTKSLGETNNGRLYRAHDSHGNRDVRLLALRRDWLEDATALTQLERDVERAASVKHANVLGVQGVESSQGAIFVVTEWTEGFSLLELLRTRRELEPIEVLALLRQAADAIDHALKNGIKSPDIALHSVLIDFPGDTTPRTELLRRPVGQWPPFVVKIQPLSFTRDLSQSETWAGGKTMVGSMSGARSAEATDPRARVVQALAAVVYELLGGTLSPLALGAGGVPRYTPLAPLTEAGNAVLKRALTPAESFPSAADFFTAMDDPENVELVRHDTAMGSTLLRTAGPAAAPGVPAPVFAAPPSPVKKSPLGAIAAVASVLVLAGAGFVFLRPKPPVPVENPPDLSAGTNGESAGNGEPKPPPIKLPPVEKTMTRQEQLKLAIENAEAEEAREAWPEAIAAWLKTMREFPESEAGKTRAEARIDRLRDRPTGMNAEEFAAMRAILIEAAETGIISAMLAIAENIRTKEPEEAFKWFSAAAEKGHPAALLNLGLMHSNGHGTTVDLAKAVQYFEQAVAKDWVEAKLALADCLLFGKGIEKDEKRAMDLLQQAVAKNHGRAADMLATYGYRRGLGGIAKSDAEAAKLYQIAVDAEYNEARSNLATLYMTGQGVPLNRSKAIDLLEKGAREGSARCMFLLAVSYEEGTGISRNPQKAREWYVKAAKAGDARAADWCSKNVTP